MKQFITIVFICIVQICIAQGFNNNQQYDQQDLDFLFKKNGIEVFKFSFTSAIDSGLNIIIEEYSKGKLVKSNDLFKDFAPVLQIVDEPVTFYFPKMTDTASQTLRFYLTKQAAGLTIVAKTSKIERPYVFNPKNIKLTQTRAFDYIPSGIKAKQPLFVYYGTAKKDLLSCPGDLGVERIVKMYDYVIVVYADILKQ